MHSPEALSRALSGGRGMGWGSKLPAAAPFLANTVARWLFSLLPAMFFQGGGRRCHFPVTLSDLVQSRAGVQVCCRPPGLWFPSNQYSPLFHGISSICLSQRTSKMHLASIHVHTLKGCSFSSCTSDSYSSRSLAQCKWVP